MNELQIVYNYFITYSFSVHVHSFSEVLSVTQVTHPNSAIDFLFCYGLFLWNNNKLTFLYYLLLSTVSQRSFSDEFKHP